MEEKKENKNLIPRPPIVVVMGHIDHGKTKLLDAIRETNVVDKESGGITQHIGAYEIVVSSDNKELNGRKITFLDTPGHEAFSKMRARGADIGDVAVLIVAADEGVKPQTLEALKHIQKLNMPYVVAINKIDKPEANSEKVKQQLAENEVLLEGWGGNVPFVLISAKQRQNINDLLEMILLVSDMEELKADKTVPCSGVVVEARMDSKKGILTTLIIKQGVLSIGDEITTATVFGKVKILEDFNGNSIKQASFSSPVLVGGFKTLPIVGEEFFVGKPEIPHLKKEIDENEESIEETSDIENINLIIKADTAGSLEALENVLKNFKIEGKEFKIINSLVGNISISDIQMAKNTPAWILGFGAQLSKELEITAKADNIKIFLFKVIYELEKFLEEEAEKVFKEKAKEKIGELKVLVLFSSQKNKKLIGGVVEKGNIIKNSMIKIMRDEEEIGKGKIITLQCQKQEMKEVGETKECGLMIQTETEIEKGDRIVLK